MDRRTALRILGGTPLLVGCRPDPTRDEGTTRPAPAVLAPNVVVNVEPLGALWKTRDPFLFCAHHDDAYPKGNDKLGPAEALAGRNIGSDFDPKERWRMYHGENVPGFPEHPHRGFETVTVVRSGLVDHSDSLGAAARYGGGDVQWLTAGKGIVHAEMFPLLDAQGDNPLELFQIWMNLPSVDKMVEPHFSMLWNSSLPRHAVIDAQGKSTEVTVIAGTIAGVRAPSPPPHSWAARASNEVAIWTIKMPPNARFAIPAGGSANSRMLYFFKGKSLRVGDRTIEGLRAIELRPDAEASLENGAEESELLLLQGRRIAEPVAQRGPFVMNTQAELQQAFADYRATQFGGWPWKRTDPVHDREARFARHANGRFEKAT